VIGLQGKINISEDFNMEKSIFEQMCGTYQMAWAGCMNNIRERAVEIINAESVYT